MIQLTSIYHRIIAEQQDINVAVDMTCGHGFDTLFLAKFAKKVYAFDIQEQAIEETRFRTKDYRNITLIQDNHEHIKKHIHEKVDLAVFNLGYMPGGNLSICTQTTSTINALKHLYDLLAIKGFIIIEVYPHNPEETEAVKNFAKGLEPRHDVVYLDLINKQNAPSLIVIRKN